MLLRSGKNSKQQKKHLAAAQKSTFAAEKMHFGGSGKKPSEAGKNPSEARAKPAAEKVQLCNPKSCRNGKNTFPQREKAAARIARQAAQYPPKLVRAVLKCLRDELESKGELSAVEAQNAGPVAEVPLIDPRFEEMFVDDVNGGILPTEEVKKARQKEMACAGGVQGCTNRGIFH